MHKYQNPDPKCTYWANGNDYCWSYAHHVDGTRGYEDMTLICKLCDMYKDNICKVCNRSLLRTELYEGLVDCCECIKSD